MSWNDHPDFDPCVGCGLGAVEQYHGQWWCAGCVRDEKNAHASKPPLARITGVLGEHKVDITEVAHNSCICGWRGTGTDGDWDAHVARALIRDSGWDILMELLDAHYPASVFPTREDDPGRDPGPRIVSLIRRIDEIRTRIGTLLVGGLIGLAEERAAELRRRAGLRAAPCRVT